MKKKSKSTLLIYFFGLIVCNSSLSQNNNESGIFQNSEKTILVKGKIQDAFGPIQGVTIIIKGTSIGTVSELNGNYTIKAGVTDSLIYSFLGYKTEIIPINNQNNINVFLKDDTTTLKEVVLNAGYYSIKDKERTGSISRITADEIEKQPIPNIIGTMAGRMAGVNIVQNSGVPGSGFSIQIRGINSLRPEGNKPLYIIDGVPYLTENMGDTGISGSILPGQGINPLSSINPSDIASIEVLKDADATAIYGSRGANGVVLITTKKGKPGKTEVHVNIWSGMGRVTRFQKLMNTQQYIAMREKAFENDGISEYPFFAYDVNGTWDRNRYTDWQKELIGGTALTQNAELSFGGGSESTRFSIRGTNYGETTVFPGDFKYNRTNIHWNINYHNPGSNWTLNISGIYGIEKNNLLAMDLTREATTLAPNAPALYDENGNLNWENSTWNNPLRLLNEKYNATTNTLILGGDIAYKINEHWNFKTMWGFTDNRVRETRQVPNTIYDPAFGLDSSFSYLLQNEGVQNAWNIEPQIHWNTSKGKNKWNFLAGLTLQERTADQLSIFGGGFSNNSLIGNMAAASNLFIFSNDETKYRYGAIFGRANFTHNETYILNLTGRRDGSSRFGPGKRFANFGAIGAAWIFSNNQKIKQSLPFLSFGKLRSSFGTTGNDQIGDYQYLNTFVNSGTLYDGIVGFQPSRLFNPNFSWEINTKWEIALETGFFEDKIRTSFAYFNNKSSNQLIGIPLPGTTGFPSIQSNLDATVQNTGFEIEMKTANISNETLKWDTSINLSFIRNKLLEFPNLESSTYANQWAIGYPINIRKVFEFTGIHPETGIYQFTDFNNDGVITSPDDRQKIVDLNPELIGGILNSIQYKNWQLDFLFQFVKQLGINQTFNGITPGILGNQPVGISNEWQSGQTSAGSQIYTSGINQAAVNSYFNFLQSDAAITDASYVRLKNLSLSYRLPNQWLKNGSCNIYVQGQNLLTFTKFSGADPENQTFGRIPPLRVITMGINLNF